MQPASTRSRRQPWSVLASLTLVQWLLLLLLTHRIVHNEWLFSQDGTATYFYSAAWSFAHGHLPPPLVGYGWPLLTSPIAGITGVDFLDGLPALVLVQTLVLLPLALVTVYGVASCIGGRALGYLAATCWVLVPYVVHPLFAPGYHSTYVQQLLPQGLGLTGLGDFPSMLCVLVTAYFVVGSMDTGDLVHAALGGLFAGFAIAVDPGNVLFLAAPLVGYTLTRRSTAAATFAVALVPALATVTVWQYRGLGHVPHIHAQVDLHRLHLLSLDFRSVFYSDRLIEVPFLAGLIGLGRRSWIKSTFVGVWFLSYLLVRGSAAGTDIGSGTWFGAFMPAFPAFLIACCSILLLVPRLGERVAHAPAAHHLPRLHWRDLRLSAAAVALAVVPLVVVATLPVEKHRKLVMYADDHVLVPVTNEFRPQANGQPGAGVVTWSAVAATGATPFYIVFRSPDDGSGGLSCPAAGRATRCTLTMPRIGSSTASPYLDIAPPVPAGRWIYRVALAANWHTDPNASGLMLLSPPVGVTVP